MPAVICAQKRPNIVGLAMPVTSPKLMIPENPREKPPANFYLHEIVCADLLWPWLYCASCFARPGHSLMSVNTFFV